MFYPFALLAVSVLMNIQNHTTLSANITFPADIRLWCPYTQFCDLEAKYPLPSQGKNNGYKLKPCCDSCSCSADCGLKRKCCRDEFDLYKIDETLGTICRQLNTKVETIREDIHYHVVDKCPGKHDTCRFQNFKNWWNFFPVYSRSNGMIYYNKYCAECHNQTDLVEFIPSLVCPSLYGPLSTILPYVLNEGSEECYLQFLVPSRIDVSAEECYPYLEMRRDCKAANTSEAALMKDLCGNFNATFRRISYYQNIYCYLCGLKEPDFGQRWIEDYTICKATDSKRFLTRSSLLVLLDDNSVASYEKSLSEDVNNKYICIETVTNSTTNSCRPVFCPEGQFRVKGDCRYFGQTWYVQNVQLFVKLTPVDPVLNLNHLHQITNEQLASSKKEFLFSPELQDWEKELFYRTNDNETTVQYLLAFLFLRTQTVRPSILTEKVEKSLQHIWKLNIEGEIFELRPEFNRYISYSEFQDGTTTIFVPQWQSITKTVDEDYVIVWSKGFPSDFRAYRICITKLFYCEQVSLHLDEFRILPGEVLLVAMNKTIGYAEVISAINPDGRITEIRVCLSDVLEEKRGVGHRWENWPIIYLILGLICRTLSELPLNTF